MGVYVGSQVSGLNNGRLPVSTLKADLPPASPAAHRCQWHCHLNRPTSNVERSRRPDLSRSF